MQTNITNCNKLKMFLLPYEILCIPSRLQKTITFILKQIKYSCLYLKLFECIFLQINVVFSKFDFQEYIDNVITLLSDAGCDEN